LKVCARAHYHRPRVLDRHHFRFQTSAALILRGAVWTKKEAYFGGEEMQNEITSQLSKHTSLKWAYLVHPLQIGKPNGRRRFIKICPGQTSNDGLVQASFAA